MALTAPSRSSTTNDTYLLISPCPVARRADRRAGFGCRGASAADCNTAAFIGGFVCHVVDRDGFERSLAQWKRTGKATRLDRVSHGHAGTKHAARLRPPRGRSATVGLTDAPSLVRTTSRGNRYLGSVWVRASAKAVRNGALTVRLGVRAKTAGGGATAWRRIRLTGGGWHQITVPVTSRRD